MSNKIIKIKKKIPYNGADFLAALEAKCFLGALAPVDFLAVYLVLAILG